jgi:hypothetical protein
MASAFVNTETKMKSPNHQKPKTFYCLDVILVHQSSSASSITYVVINDLILLPSQIWEKLYSSGIELSKVKSKGSHKNRQRQVLPWQ